MNFSFRDKNKRSKKIYLALAIFLIILLVSLSVLKLKIEKQKKINIEKEKLERDYPKIIRCKNLQDKEKNICFFKLISEKQDERLCIYFDKEKAMKAMCEYHVLANKAVKTYNYRLCYNISSVPFAIGEQGVDDPVGECVLFVAEEINDTSLCKKINSHVIQDKCYLEIAAATNNESLCKNIRSQTGKDACYASIALSKKNISLCSNIKKSVYSHDNCYNGMAKATNDENICAEINDPHTKASCYTRIGIIKNNPNLCDNLQDYEQYIIDSCYKRIAENFTDENLCNRITLVGYWADCLIDIAGMSKNASLCTRLEGVNISPRGIPYPAINPCYRAVAHRAEDENVCMNISIEWKKIDCIQDIAEAKKNETICLLIRNSSVKTSLGNTYPRIDCLMKVAYVKKDENICKMIDTSLRKDDCLKSLANRKNDENICDMIQFKFIKDDCFEEIANRKIDESICDKIQSEYTKDKCHENIQTKLIKNP